MRIIYEILTGKKLRVIGTDRNYYPQIRRGLKWFYIERVHNGFRRREKSWEVPTVELIGEALSMLEEVEAVLKIKKHFIYHKKTK